MLLRGVSVIDNYTKFKVGADNMFETEIGAGLQKF